MASSKVSFTVNNVQYSVSDDVPRDTTLNAYLRYTLELPGTKAMCQKASCGACSVNVRARRYPSGQIESFTVNSCIVLIHSCNGWDITTIEGLGNKIKGYDEIQTRIAAFNGTQCGYCTPGWVMHMHSLRDKGLTMAEIEKSFASHICRCTGFRPILDTMKSFAVDASPQLCAKVKDIQDNFTCCKSNSSCCQTPCSITNDAGDWTLIDDTDKTLEVKFASNEVFLKVYKEKEIFNAFKKFGTSSYMLIDGNTSKATRDDFEYPNVLIDISDVESLKQFSFDQNLVLGANISLENCIKIFRDTAKSRSDEFAYLAEFADHFELIAHMLVRNIGSLAGNLMTKNASPSFQSDVFLLFSAVNAMIVVRDDNKHKKNLSMSEFLNFDMNGKLMQKIELPPLSNLYYFRSYKIMERHQQALAIVNAAFLVKLNKTTKVIEEASIAYGNINSKFVRATQTENYIKNKNIFDNDTLQQAIKVLNKEIVPAESALQASPNARRKLAIGLFYKFILNISSPQNLDPRYRTGSSKLVRPLSKGTQEFETKPEMYPLTEPRQKYEGLLQSSGSAEYVNDIPSFRQQVFGAFVLATIHSGEIDQIDKTEVMEIKGVVDVLTANDIPGENTFITLNPSNLMVEYEEILVGSKIRYYGQPVAIVVAESEALAQNAAKKVKVAYKNVSTTAPVLTIEQARNDTTRYVANTTIAAKGRGNDVKNVIKGTFRGPTQYANYMEPMSCVVVPVDGKFEVYHGSQRPELVQGAIAKCLNIDSSKVLVKNRRIGGSFGGKITRFSQVSTSCALVANKLDRTCRFILPLETSMAFTGKRMESLWDYEAGIDDNGKIQYLEGHMVYNKGYSINDNHYSLATAPFGNVYQTDYMSLELGSVLTDIPCNTFIRAPGALETISYIEQIMEHISVTIQKDAVDVRLTNLVPTDDNTASFIKECREYADYDKRVKEAEEFNQANRWMKKAVKLSVMNFHIDYLGNFTAIVSIYRTDGSVAISTNGLEIGQGLHTKAIQVCAYELGVPVEKIAVVPHDTFVSANNSPTFLSFTSELVCYTVTKACAELKARLEPIKQTMEDATWEELILAAADKGVDLVAKHTFATGTGELPNYTILGAAVMEVQLDILTGLFEILRVDLLEETGQSINPLVDVGQIEGAFVMGLGCLLHEKLIFDKNSGKMLTDNNLKYHVPLALDIPADFRIKFKPNPGLPGSVLGSKASGEMGVCTSNVALYALRHCIMQSRNDSGYEKDEWIDIDVPYNPESVLTALDVKLEELILS